jgi:hypothetical protein
MYKSRKRSYKKLSKKAVAKIHGFRSGFENDINDKLSGDGISFTYESEVLKYIQPETTHKYTPDFKIMNSQGCVIYLETKGRWVSSDMKKMKLIKQQYPDLDIRIMFQDSNKKINKTSKTTYGQKATSMGYLWCDLAGGIPQEWLDYFK